MLEIIFGNIEAKKCFTNFFSVINNIEYDFSPLEFGEKIDSRD